MRRPCPIPIGWRSWKRREAQPCGYSRDRAARARSRILNWRVRTSASTWRRPTARGRLPPGDSTIAELAGVRAPKLDRKPPKAWTEPEALFNGKDLAGWEPTSTSAPNHWVVKGGELVNEEHGANIKTTRKFDDFKLHIEYNCPDEGNSGIYLRGRYEVQVEYEKVDANDKFHSMGSIYSFVAPGGDLPRKPGTWESFDMTFVGRYVTIVPN